MCWPRTVLKQVMSVWLKRSAMNTKSSFSRCYWGAWQGITSRVAFDKHMGRLLSWDGGMISLIVADDI